MCVYTGGSYVHKGWHTCAHRSCVIRGWHTCVHRWCVHRRAVCTRGVAHICAQEVCVRMGGTHVHTGGRVHAEKSQRLPSALFLGGSADSLLQRPGPCSSQYACRVCLAFLLLSGAPGSGVELGDSHSVVAHHRCTRVQSMAESFPQVIVPFIPFLWSP